MAQATGLIAKKGIELLTYGTPNGFKIAILLSELNIPYTVQAIDLFQGVQKQPWFTALNPNAKIPVIVDHDKGGLVVWESLVIMRYLVERFDGKGEGRLGFRDKEDGVEEGWGAEKWIAWAHTGLSPMQTQANAFYRFMPTRQPFPTAHYVGNLESYYTVLDAHLSNRDYIAGAGRGRYSIADIAVWPFADALAVAGLELTAFPNVYAWWERVGQREAVKKGMCVPSGEPFRFGYAKVVAEREKDKEGWEERERPLREALERGRA